MENVIHADLDELVFRSRNKEYGAYLLRKMIPRNTFQAFVITAVGLGLLILLPVTLNLFSAVAADEVVTDNQIELTEIPPMDEEEPEPEPPPVEPPPPPQQTQVQFTPPEIVNIEEAKPEVTIIEQDTVDHNVGTQNVVGNTDEPIIAEEQINVGTGPVEIQQPVEEEPDPNKFYDLDETPRPVNMDAVKPEYPQMARDAGIYGKVIVRVLVSEEGKYVKHKIMRSPDPILTQAVEAKLPKLVFTPAISHQRPVKAWVTIPFDFKNTQ